MCYNRFRIRGPDGTGIILDYALEGSRGRYEASPKTLGLENPKSPKARSSRALTTLARILHVSELECLALDI